MKMFAIRLSPAEKEVIDLMVHHFRLPSRPYAVSLALAEAAKNLLKNRDLHARVHVERAALKVRNTAVQSPEPKESK